MRLALILLLLLLAGCLHFRATEIELDAGFTESVFQPSPTPTPTAY